LTTALVAVPGAIRLALVGLSHHTAPLTVRERFVCEQPAARERVHRALREFDTDAVLLSTCNRTELYMAAPEQLDPVPVALDALVAHASAAGLEGPPHGDWFYVRRERDAVQHLFRVAAGLDSMVVGEAQIQGQVRSALDQSIDVLPGRRPQSAVLRRLFDSALCAGGRVRAETRLGIGAASVPSAAVELARKIFGTLDGRRALVIGSGEMSELALRCFTAEGVRGAVVAGRTAEKTEALARRAGAEAGTLDGLAPLLASADIVVTATSAPRPVVTVPIVKRALKLRGRQPLLIVDIAMPRDVETEVGALNDVFLYDLDDLRAVIDGTLDRRRGEIEHADSIVAQANDEYWEWHLGRGAVPLIRELRGRAEQVRQDELARALRSLRHLPQNDRAAIESLTRQLMAKLLHAPTARLREAAANGRDAEVAEIARYLFALDDEVGAGSIDDAVHHGQRNEKANERT
jgi:glutamyl-tRNA reductase